MPGIIKARIAETEDSTFYSFDVIGYEDPLEVVARDLPYEWHYLNAQGFVQTFNPVRPPSKYPCVARLIMVRCPVYNTVPAEKVDTSIDNAARIW